MRRLLLVLLAALAAALLPAAPASAHAALLQSTPEDGVVLPEAPDEVALRFNQPVGTGLGAVRVVGPDGERVDDGAPVLREGDHVVAVPVPRAGDHGTYVLLWRVMSEDGHAVGGASTFSVGAPSAPATAVEADDATTTPALRSARLVGLVGLLVLVGTVVVTTTVWPVGLGLPRVHRLLAAGLGLAALGSAGTLLAQGPSVAALPLSRAPELLPEVLGTRYGVAHVVRLALLAVLAALLVALVRRHRDGRRPGAAWRAALLLVGAPLLTTWSAAGHPAAGSMPWLAVPADALHLLAVGTWAGGLVVLAAALLPRPDVDELRTALTGWSRLAVAAVVAMALTGLLASWREVRGLEALGATSYGRLLVLKTLLVLVMLYVGNRGRFLVQRYYGVGRPVVHASTATAEAPPAIPPADARRALRRSTAVEVAVAAVVVAVTAFLVDTPPAATAYARPLSTVHAVDDVRVQLDLDSARVGPNTLHVYLTGADGRAFDVPEVTGRITRGDESVPVQVERISLGHYEATERLVVPYRGTWLLEVRVRTSDVDSLTVTETLTIR